jgi:isopenicillin N synthase-like dioxygenase
MEVFRMERALPIIDLAEGSEDGAVPAQLAERIGAACRDIGFFYAVNHGVERALMNEAFAQSLRFFALPLAEKQVIAIETIGGNRGYSGLLHEALDPSRGPDRKEAFNIGFDLEPNDPELLAGKPFRALNAWPKLEGFRETLLAYYDACAALGARIHRAFARDLGVEPGFFADKFDRPMATLRLLRYPAAESAGREFIGAGTHTDYGNLTLLATDEVGGLEVRTRAGTWIEAPPLAGAFVVNIGDCLMRWTNDVYVSTPHRVVNRSGRERYSIAFFFDPNPDAEVAVMPSCVSPGESVRYPPVLAADYLRFRLDASKPTIRPEAPPRLSHDAAWLEGE